MLSPLEKLARDLDWNLLRTFVVIADAGSITRAAEVLGLQQPSVSTALKRLEAHLDRKLIDRKPGHFQLTEAGRLLYDEAVDINGAILRIGTAIRKVQEEVQGHVNIAIASHVVCPLLNEALRDFHARHPAATLSIEVSASRDAIEKLLSRRVSFAICLVKDRNPRLEYRRLFREFFGLFCGPSHPLFGRQGLATTELAGQASVSFVTDQMNDALRPVTLMRAMAGLEDRVVGSSANLEEVRRMIVAGLGIGPLPLHVVREDVARGQLWRLPPYDDPPAIDVHVVWNARARMNRAETSLLTGLLEKIDQTPESDRIYF
ncbi:LysR family transcriptional regulator [Szabonella alba]|uniref:LysR family transcriptional regulator n=1 Tax=Szabonella alba TaxID=2804194 RepID=A0A8K0VH35_9RHOB|nr:LysR family transcriptional regulator [Szabonella alba]MBL4919362.1 LysR family transcriptional regulator [Szabonella alba]